MAREAALATELARLVEALARMTHIAGVGIERIGASGDEWRTRELRQQGNTESRDTHDEETPLLRWKLDDDLT
jgi:hypothetical protein